IAYIGKDRQDSIRAKVIKDENIFSAGTLGRFNASIINNLIVNVVENSYGKNYIKLDKEYYDDLMLAMEENYKLIYLSDSVRKVQQEVIKPMFAKVFDSLLQDILNGKKDSVIFRHHVNYISKVRAFYSSDNYLELNTPEDIVIDYISSMTDDYFSDMYSYLFPKSSSIKYVSYFDSRD
ncbi:MAG: phosphohydrolase, partial [Clostridia bacterium]|nr:phosphohydrolase [Clostridia bacterium]